MPRPTAAGFGLLILFALAGGPAAAQDTAGVFDYYVVSLSWSPNWCAIEGDARGSPQCDADAEFGWVLHGLWPQYEDGYPQDCRTVYDPPSRADTGAMADIMGTSGLAWHQWNKHGSCAGLDPDDYFALARTAFARIVQPPVFGQIDRTFTLPAAVVEEAFLRSNPDLSPDGITITCRDGHIQEARICLTRDLDPRVCGADVVRDCSLRDALFEPIR